MSSLGGLPWFLTRRLASAVMTMVGLITIVFVMTKLIPGSEARVAAGPEASPAQVAQMSRQLGLDKPIAAQYFLYLNQVLHGNLGTSILSHQSVLSGIVQVFPSTAQLVILALLLAVSVAVPAATYSAVRRVGFTDTASRTFIILAAGLPTFWLALMLQLLLATDVRVFPVSGALSVNEKVPVHTGMTIVDSLIVGNFGAFGDALWHMVLPALVLAVPLTAELFRALRVQLIATLQREHITVAKAKGVPMSRLLLRHALPNALGAVITLVGVYVGVLMASAILVESIFGLSGVGSYLYNAVSARDVFAVLGGVIAVGTVVILANLAADIVQMIRDPWLRAGELGRSGSFND